MPPFSMAGSIISHIPTIYIIYHYAKKVEAINASARFIILNVEGKETINRLVETDLKSYLVKK